MIGIKKVGIMVGSKNEMMSHKEPKSAEKPSIRIKGKYENWNTIVTNTATNGPTMDLFLPLGPMLGFILKPCFCSDELKCTKTIFQYVMYIIKTNTNFNLLSTLLGKASDSPISITLLMFALNFSYKIKTTMINEIIAKVNEGTLLFLERST